MSNRYSRQLIVFRAEGQTAIERQSVVIAGVGGLGSQLAQSLAYLGVMKFALIDPDRVEESNLNRLVGAYPEDAKNNAFKVDVIKRHIEKINPTAEVQAIPRELRTETSFNVVRRASVLFGCFDNDTARLILMEFASAYRIPYIDAASDFELDESESHLVGFGGRVVVAEPGDFCLRCAGELDEAEAEAGLKSEKIASIRRQHGYGRGKVTSASVVTLNGLIANVAATEFMVMVTKLRKPARKRVYKGLDGGVMLRNEDSGNPDCYTCRSLIGMGDAAELDRYLIHEDGELRQHPLDHDCGRSEGSCEVKHP